jgi:hypothetical protein
MKKDNKKPLPDFIQRSIPQHQWNTLHPVPTWEGVLYYDPLDFDLDRPLTFYRRLRRRGAKADFIYPMRVYQKDVNSSHCKHGSNHKPMYRRYIKFKWQPNLLLGKCRSKVLYCHQLTMLCWMGFAINDPRHWVVDHIDGNSLNDRPKNLQVISQRENCRRSPKVRAQARKNCEMINARRKARKSKLV